MSNSPSIPQKDPRILLQQPQQEQGSINSTSEEKEEDIDDPVVLDSVITPDSTTTTSNSAISCSTTTMSSNLLLQPDGDVDNQLSVINSFCDDNSSAVTSSGDCGPGRGSSPGDINNNKLSINFDHVSDNVDVAQSTFSSSPSTTSSSVTSNDDIITRSTVCSESGPSADDDINDDGSNCFPQTIQERLSSVSSSSSSSILSTTSTLKDNRDEDQEPIQKFKIEPYCGVVDSSDTNIIITTQASLDSSPGTAGALSSPSSESDSNSFHSASATSSSSSQEYHLKWIKWKGNKVPIVTQNSNGPCPLLAIINVLLLRKNICFPPMIEIITATQLMEYLCDCMLNNVPKNLSEDTRLNYEQNFQDALTVLPRLPTGLDVNVRFTGFSDFEYTPECIIFDLLRIPLYHGWLVDPSDREIFRIVNTLSYNQLVDRIITSKGSSNNSTASTDMFIAEEFLNQSASQLTNYGLFQLIQRVKEDELCILFRNNHFITLYKYKSKLFQLVTDQGFLTESNVVWETLTNIEGDSRFMDGDFVLVPPKPAIAASATTTTAASDAAVPLTNTQQQIDQDYLIALSLEQEQKLTASPQVQSNPNNTTALVECREPPSIGNLSSALPATTATTTTTTQLSDEEFARKLQLEEDQRSYELMQQQQQQNRPNVPGSGQQQQPSSAKSAGGGSQSQKFSHYSQQQPLDNTGGGSRNNSRNSRSRTTSSGSGSSSGAVGTTTERSSGRSSATGTNHRTSHHHQQHRGNQHHSSSSSSNPSDSNNPNNDRDSVNSKEGKSKNCTIS